MSPTSRSPQAVLASITDRLNQYAEANGHNPGLVRRRFVMARFLARVFDADPDSWMLKGGVGMMVRLPQARYSFEVGTSIVLSNKKGSTVPVAALIAGKRFDTFCIDIVDGRRELVGQVERHPLPRLVDTDDFPLEASVQLYPLADPDR